MRKAIYSLSPLKLCALAAAVLLTATVDATADNKNTCESTSAILTSDYDAGAMTSCSSLIPSIFRVVIAPEDEEAAQRSPWYSFKITNKDSEMLIVDINYIDGEHRFTPLISTDGENWAELHESQYREVDDRRVQLFLPALDTPFYISAQEIFANDRYEAWMSKLVASGAVKKSLLGTSVQDRPIYKIQSESTANTGKYIFLIGRQHPAEVPGAIAMLSFVDTIYSDTALAREFRSQYGIVSVPQVNPDGVALGHWRHNTGGWDLNYAWSVFTQKETTVVGKELQRFKTAGDVELFIDFHSTYDHLFYTQTGKSNEWPSNFTRNWQRGVYSRLPNFYHEHTQLDYGQRSQDFTRGSGATRYAYNLLGATTMVYEVDEDARRENIQQIAHVVAEEIMRVMLSSGTN